ncbi:F-box protein CPR1-like [Silene latifolia]|uniref:F-box protein CPR1-like n=1 Tax=Silene latifolia TaxID=37657 RepID=UPI003D76F729
MPRLPSLPQEIISEIFTRLPAKCIGRYRCLSKSWCHLLSELHFINRHIAQTRLFTDNELFMLNSTNSNTLYSGTIVRHSYGEMTVLATELNFVVSPKCRVWGTSSCDGLILLIENAKSDSLLVNPTTKEVRELNIPSHDLDVYPRVTTYGLGYDHVNDDYKVVLVSSYSLEHEPKMFANVYSVRNGSWKQLETSPYHHVSPGVFVGGSIHWIALNPSDYLNFGNPAYYSYFIAGFDLTTEKFWKVPAPSSMFDEASEYYNLGILGECLCMFSSVSEKKINIWVMKEYGVMESWTKFSIVDEQGSKLMPLKGVMGQRELVMMKDDFTPYERLSMHNLDTATFQDMKVKGINEGFNLGWSFKETLVSPYYKYN